MKNFLFYFVSHIPFLAFCKDYPTSIEQITIKGFDSFPFTIWHHPLQNNPHIKNTFFTEEVFKNINFLPKDSVIIDIGAHTGDTSVMYARALGPKSIVIAFEPCGPIYNVLKKNSKLSTNIIPYNLAITEEDGFYSFSYTDDGFCNGGFSSKIQNEGVFFGKKIPYVVQGVNFENFIKNYHPELLDKINFIKIDTEGYDRFILKSLSHFIQKNKPILQIEVYPSLSTIEKKEFFELIESLNYNCFLGGLESFSSDSIKLDKNAFTNITFCDCVLIPENL